MQIIYTVPEQEDEITFDMTMLHGIDFSTLIILVAYELKNPFAIIPAAVLKSKALILSLLSTLAGFAVVSVVSFLLPFAL